MMMCSARMLTTLLAMCAASIMGMPAHVHADVVVAHIDRLQVLQEKNTPEYELIGTASAERFKRAWITIGEGEDPQEWKRIGRKLKHPVVDGSLMRLPATEFTHKGLWQVELYVEAVDGTTETFRLPLRLQ